MANELTVNTLGDAVRDRVKKALFDSIPDTAIENLIQNEFTKMTSKTRDEWAGSQRRQMSELEFIIATEIKKQLQERSSKSVSQYLDQTYTNQSKEMVDAAIKDLAPLFMAGMIENFTSAAINGLRNQLSQKGIYL